MTHQSLQFWTPFPRCITCRGVNPVRVHSQGPDPHNNLVVRVQYGLDPHNNLNEELNKLLYFWMSDPKQA